MGVLFFILNAVFALVLLILVIWASVSAILSKNPDTRYQPMRDDRGSFIKSNSSNNLNDELDALGVAARGDGAHSQMSMMRAADQEKIRRPRMPLDDESGDSGRTLMGEQRHSDVVPMESHTSLKEGSALNGTESPGQHNEGPWKRGVGY
jgi:hypothetical protein